MATDWQVSEVNATKKTEWKPPIAHRFRGYLPVVIDIETAGFNADTDAILEIAISLLDMDEAGTLSIKETLAYNIQPFEGANLEQAALDFNGIDPADPKRCAMDEKEGLKTLLKVVRQEVKANSCKRAIVVAHNANFDHQFLNAAIERNNIKRNPFHPFSSMDTATLAGFAYGHTVLAQACRLANIEFDNKAAHSAAYDTEVTAQLFCKMVNQWRDYGGWDKALEAKQRLAENANSKTNETG